MKGKGLSGKSPSPRSPIAKNRSRRPVLRAGRSTGSSGLLSPALSFAFLDSLLHLLSSRGAIRRLSVQAFPCLPRPLQAGVLYPRAITDAPAHRLCPFRISSVSGRCARKVPCRTGGPAGCQVASAILRRFPHSATPSPDRASLSRNTAARIFSGRELWTSST